MLAGEDARSGFLRPDQHPPAGHWRSPTVATSSGAARSSWPAPPRACSRARLSRRSISADRCKQRLQRSWAGTIDTGWLGGYADPVFCTGLGAPLPLGNVTRYWHRACKRGGLDPVPRSHDLRHFAITTMLLAGIPINIVSEMGGHHNASMTFDRYRHLLARSKHEGAAALGEALRQGRGAAALRLDVQTFGDGRA